MDDLTTRRQLAETRIALRLAHDVYDLVQAQAAQRTTDAAGGPKGLGINSEDRALIIALAADEECRIAHGTVRDYQGQGERLQARVYDEIDDSRHAQRARLDRIPTALEIVNMQPYERGSVISIVANPQAA